MAENAIADTGFIVALLSRRDTHHGWATAQAETSPPPWLTCEAVLAEAFHVLEDSGVARLRAFLDRRGFACAFQFSENSEPTLRLLEKYADVPMSFADACLVRMTETINDPVVLTTDNDFRVYRRHGRQVIPAALPR